MGNMTITDGRTGTPHITAAEVWAANVGIWGDGDRLLATGQNMRAQIINNNTVRIYDGVVSLQGLRCGIPYGQYLDMTIQNGTAGQKRRDAIYIEYTYNSTLRTMDTDLKVKKGTPGTSYVSPTLQTGDIAGGALTHQGLLYYVDINGITISKVEGKMQPPTLSVDYITTDSDLEGIYGNAATLKNILEALGTDYIIEQKVDNGTTIEKWASGKMIKRIRVQRAVSITTASAGFYVSPIQTFDLGGDEFVTGTLEPFFTATIIDPAYQSWGTLQGFPSSTQVKMRVASTQSISASSMFNVMLIGRWK